MMKNYFLPALFLLTTTSLFSQRYADKWYFGNKAGLDFTGGAPTVITSSQMAAGEGSASVADYTTGAVLFYTDGISVWNKNDVVMPNGTGLLAGFSSTQAALIVPAPGSSTSYYIFTTDQTGGSQGLRFSKVDMTLDGGNGDVTTKNVLLKAPVTEKITAAQEPGSGNIWLLTHGWGDDAFYAFRITSTGIDSAVVSNVGIVHSTGMIQNSYGQMKFNPCCDKVALAAGYLNKVEILDFDVSTGVVSNPKTISYSDHVYGVEFSVDGNVLYVSTYDPSATLIQYDLTISNVSTMVASANTISATPDIYPLQRARDQKIYVCKSYSQFLGVINSPNDIGTVACDYVDNAIDLDPAFMAANSGLGLPNFVQSFMGGTQFCSIITGEEEVAGAESMSNVFPNPSGSDFILVAKENNVSVTIMDVSGKALESHNQVLNGNQFRFGQQYLPGVYLVKTVDDRGHSTLLKVLKTR